MRAALVVCACAILACSSSSSSPASSNDAGGGAGLGDWDPTPFGGDRPTQLYVPTSYRPDAPMPLVVMLHGYGASGLLEELLLNLRPIAEARGFLYVHPDGTIDKQGKRFWNATDACCDFDASPVDDSKYLAGLVAEIERRYTVDTKRVFFVGHSNGAFMSYRMACDHAETIAAIASLAGATWLDTSKCRPSAPVAALQIHGTADTEVIYNGTPNYPSATTTVEDWATSDGCALTADTSAAPIDIDDSVPGAETTIARYASGCRAGTDAELWSIAGGQHVPGVNDNFRKSLVDFLFAHPKP